MWNEQNAGTRRPEFKIRLKQHSPASLLRLQKLQVVTAGYLGKAGELSAEAGVGPGTARDRASWTEPEAPQVRPPAGFRLPGAPQSGSALLGRWAR